jgi:hypothetical protein
MSKFSPTPPLVMSHDYQWDEKQAYNQPTKKINLMKIRVLIESLLQLTLESITTMPFISDNL